MYNLVIFENFSSNGEKTGQGKEIFFHKTGISNSKFNPKIKEGDKCLFDIYKGIYFIFYLSKMILFSLGDKGIIAKNIVIYYRPIPKIKHKQINLVQDEKNLKMALFTNTM
jgi:hypothetical protein